MNMNGLTKTDGYAHEDLLRILRKRGIQHKVKLSPTRGRSENSANHFRYSEIEVAEKDLEALHDLGARRNRGSSIWILKGYNFHAEYEVGPDFDISQLNGLVMYRKGRLVEMTRVGYDWRS